MENCIFCQIVSKKSSAQIVYEDEKVLALTPLKRVSKGHILLIPKEHFESIFDIDEEVLAYLSKIMKKLSHDLIKKYDATGINLLNANGKDAQQSIFHFHFHLVPRYPNDGLDMWIKQKL